MWERELDGVVAAWDVIGSDHNVWWLLSIKEGKTVSAVE